jgi:hypothetical protein
VDIITGALSGSDCHRRAAASVAIVDKTTEAFIGEGVDVIANAQAGIDAATGIRAAPTDGLLNDIIDSLGREVFSSGRCSGARGNNRERRNRRWWSDLYNLISRPTSASDLALLNARRTASYGNRTASR